MIHLSGIPNKETVDFMDPEDGKMKKYVAISPIESTIVVLLQDGAAQVPLTNPTIAAPAPTVADPAIVSTFRTLNQPFPTNKTVLFKVVSINPLDMMSPRESAAFQAAVLRMKVSNSAFDDRSPVDIISSRANAPFACVVEGAAAGCEGSHQFGTTAVNDRAALPAFIMKGLEEFVMTLVSLLPGGFVVDPGHFDVLDRTRTREGIPLQVRYIGYHIGPEESMDSNASRYSSMQQGGGQSVPSNLAGARR